MSLALTSLFKCLRLRSRLNIGGFGGIAWPAMVFVGLSGCAPIFELSACYDIHQTHGDNPTAQFALRQYFSKEPVLERFTGFAEYRHGSSIPDGAPFGGADKELTDMGCIGGAMPLWKSTKHSR